MMRYIPLDPEYYDTLKNALASDAAAAIHYFDESGKWVTAKTTAGTWKKSESGEYLPLDGGKDIRLDRIIAVNGKPGPAYDEYDSYALACLDCQGGMD